MLRSPQLRPAGHSMLCWCAMGGHAASADAHAVPALWHAAAPPPGPSAMICFRCSSPLACCVLPLPSARTALLFSCSPFAAPTNPTNNATACWPHRLLKSPTGNPPSSQPRVPALFSVTSVGLVLRYNRTAEEAGGGGGPEGHTSRRAPQRCAAKRGAEAG